MSQGNALYIARSRIENMPKDLLLSFINIYLSDLDINIPVLYSMPTDIIFEEIIIPGYKEKVEEELENAFITDIAEAITSDLDEMLDDDYNDDEDFEDED